MMRSRCSTLKRLPGALSCLLLLLAPSSKADIFAFVDAQGIVHYSNVPSDKRYVLFVAEPRPERVAEPASVLPAPQVHRGGRAADYAGLIDRAARRNALDPALLSAVIAIESAFDPRAVSRAGARGLMQLLPGTVRRYGISDAFDPEQNISGGARHLSGLLRRYENNLELALAAYNAGEAAVERHGRRVPPYPETRAYVPAVLRRYRELRLTQVPRA